MKRILVLFSVLGLTACGASPKPPAPRGASAPGASVKASPTPQPSRVQLREVLLGKSDRRVSLAVATEKGAQIERIQLLDPIRYYSDSKQRQLEFPFPLGNCPDSKIRMQALTRGNGQWQSSGDRIYSCEKGMVTADLDELAQAGIQMLRMDLPPVQSKSAQFTFEFEVQNLGARLSSRPLHQGLSHPRGPGGLIESFSQSGPQFQIYAEELTNRTNAAVAVELRISGGMRVVQRVGERFHVGNGEETIAAKSIASLRARRILISQGGRSAEWELDSEGRTQFEIPANSSLQVSWLLEAGNRCELFRYGVNPLRTEVVGLDWEAGFTRDLFIGGEKVLSDGYSSISRSFEIEATTPKVHSCQGWIHLSQG